ncbi:MAG: hypothetical protein J7575_10670 [Chloroflexi bacterium]|jgi:hypothetical protein|nr:hypothetical protein [Chloroflexota bacterium]
MATLYGSIGKSVRAQRAENVAEGIQDYLGRVAAHIPAEVITVYLLGKTVAPNEPILGIWGVVCWVIAFGLRWWGTQGPGKVLNVVLTTLAFPIWAMVMGGTILGFTFGQPIATLVVLVFAVVAGALYNNQ